MARAALGLTESANFPGSIKTIAEWFPLRERALATGLFNAGTNMGAIVAPIIVCRGLRSRGAGGRRSSSTGSLGFLWVIVWLFAVHFLESPESNGNVTMEELATIRADRVAGDEVAVPWLSLVGRRQTWAFIVGKLMAGPDLVVFYLFWFPKFLDTRYGVKLSQVMWPLIAGGTWSRRCGVDRVVRMAVECADPARIQRQPGAQECDARDGGHHRSHGDGAACDQYVACRDAGRDRCRSAPGLVRERLHPGERHVSAICGGIGDRYWRLCQRSGRVGIPASHRWQDSAGKRQ